MFFDEHRDTHLIINFWPGVPERYATLVRDYCDVLLNQIHPMFDELRVSDAPLHEKILGFWRYKEGRRLFTSTEEEREYYRGYWGAGIEDWDITDMQTVFLAIGVTGLFHLFEKQLYQFLNFELGMWLISPVSRWEDLKRLLEKFDRKALVEGRCDELIDAFRNPDLSELELVANAIKHGGGNSYNQLVKSGARVVSEERLLETGKISIIDSPLSICLQDIIRYQDAVVNFWILDGAFYAHHSVFKHVRQSPDWTAHVG
jgi:hypothetical protein